MYKQATTEERIKVIQESYERLVVYHKKLYDTDDFKFLVYVNHYRMNVVEQALRSKEHIYKIIPDVPTAIFCILNEPVPDNVKAYFKSFYNEKFRIVSDEDARIRTMTNELFMVALTDPEVAKWLENFISWYEESYNQTHVGADELHIIPLRANNLILR